mgnify:CR=1 FL=1
MAKFKVIALSVGGKGNQVFKVGDTVSTDNFTDAKALVDGGFLEEIVEVKKETPKGGSKKSSKKK